MKRNFGKVLRTGIICLAIAGTVALTAYGIAAKEMRSSAILKNPVTIEGKIVSSKPKGRNLELRIDSADVPVNFLAYNLSLSFREGRYRHDIATIHFLDEKLKEGDQVKVYGFRDPKTNAIYGSDIERLGYVSLINRR